MFPLQLHARLGAVIEDTKSVALDAGEIIELPPAVLTLSATGEAIAPIHAPYMTEAVSCINSWRCSRAFTQSLLLCGACTIRFQSGCYPRTTCAWGMWTRHEVHLGGRRVARHGRESIM